MLIKPLIPCRILIVIVPVSHLAAHCRIKCTGPVIMWITAVIEFRISHFSALFPYKFHGSASDSSALCFRHQIEGLHTHVEIFITFPSAQRYISDLTAVTLNDVYRCPGILYLLLKPLFMVRKIETIQHFIGINAPIRRLPGLTANFCQLLCILAVCLPKRHHHSILPIRIIT